MKTKSIKILSDVKSERDILYILDLCVNLIKYLKWAHYLDTYYSE